MIDRIIQLLVLCLGGLLIFLVGHLLLNEVDDLSRPAPAAVTPSVGARPAPEPEKSDPNASDLATKRVKTVPVRPEESIAAPQKP